MLFSKRNFETIWFSRSFWHFGFPEHMQIIIRKLFLMENDKFFK